MRIAIHGGSGFMGYDFFRLLTEEAPDIQPVVFATSPSNLSNLKRHDCDIRLVPTPELRELDYGGEIDLVVNFSHPFVKRHELTVDEQISAYVEHFRRAHERNPELRLIHISTLSVYEPFAPGKLFDEASPMEPPEGDNYARTKVLFERQLRELPGAEEWILFVRPTVVFGPFCRPWTDNLLKAFDQGDVAAGRMAGLIQPISGRDVSVFLLEATRRFRPGTYNLGGPTTSWRGFFEAFADVVGKGRLVDVELPAPGETPAQKAPASAKPTGWNQVSRDATTFLRDSLTHPAFRRIIRPIRLRSPNWVVAPFRSFVRGGAPEGGNGRSTRPDATAGAKVNEAFLRSFFEEDRLVSLEHLRADFPGFEARPLEAFRDQIRSYYAYRFTDELFV